MISFQALLFSTGAGRENTAYSQIRAARFRG
jgi:hypothetical protein